MRLVRLQPFGGGTLGLHAIDVDKLGHLRDLQMALGRVAAVEGLVRQRPLGGIGVATLFPGRELDGFARPGGVSGKLRLPADGLCGRRCGGKGANPGLLIVAINLPGKDGLEITREDAPRTILVDGVILDHQHHQGWQIGRRPGPGQGQHRSADKGKLQGECRAALRLAFRRHAETGA